MKLKIFALAALIGTVSLAETENFTMTVTGTVIKNFCTIDNPITSFDFGTIDLSSSSSYTTHSDATSALGQDAALSNEVRSMSITCDSGTSYDVYPDIPTNGKTIGDSTIVGFDLKNVSESKTTTLASQSKHANITGNGSAQKIDVQMWFASSTGNFNDLEDNISTVIAWVLQTN